MLPFMGKPEAVTGVCSQNDIAVEKDTQGLTVLHLASLKGDEQEAGHRKHLGGPGPVRPVLGYATDVVNRLWSVYYNNSVNYQNEPEDYSVYFASALGHVAVVKMLRCVVKK